MADMAALPFLQTLHRDHRNLLRGGWSIALFSVISLTAPPAFAQASIEAAHLSPTLYFRSDAEESSSREALHTQVPAQVKAMESAAIRTLPAELDRTEALIATLETHYAYLKVKTLENTEDQAAKAARNQVGTDRSVLEAAMEERLRRLSVEKANSLGKYAFLAQNVRRDSAHALSPETESYRKSVISPALESFADSYDRMDAHISRPKASTASDATTRRAAIAQWNAAYDTVAPEESVLLGAIVDVENRDAIANGYTNAADRKYQSLGLSDALVVKTLAEVQAEAPAYRHYQEVLAKHAAWKLGVPQALSTEVNLASGKASVIPFTEARRLILDALQPLGMDYTSRFAALLDPANGRLDLAGGTHRADTGTSIDAYDAPTALYLSGYDGSLRNVSTIAHEGGHAIHRELMNVGGTPVYERSGPHYVYEGFAIFNELLLLDHATTVAKTLAEREYALERLLAKLSLELYVSAEETAFERSLYTQSVGQPLLDRAKIDTLYRASISPYEYWSISDIGQSRGWMRKELVFEDPLYLVNYLYASVIAVALYDKSHSDPQFAAKYEALLRRGFDAEPQTILASMGIRLDEPNLVKPAADLMIEE